MQNAKIISISCVLVNNNFNNGVNIINNNTSHIPFQNINNFYFLKSVIGKDGIDIPSANPIIKDYIFDDISFKFELIPPKITIKHITGDKNIKTINNIIDKLLKNCDIENISTGVGLNYELYIPNKEHNIILKDKISRSDIAGEFSKIQVVYEYEISQNTKLILTIADGIINGEDSIYIFANFHNDITQTSKIKDIVKNEYYDILKRKIDIIFSNTSAK